MLLHNACYAEMAELLVEPAADVNAENTTAAALPQQAMKFDPVGVIRSASSRIFLKPRALPMVLATATERTTPAISSSLTHRNSRQKIDWRAVVSNLQPKVRAPSQTLESPHRPLRQHICRRLAEESRSLAKIAARVLHKDSQ